MPTLSRCMAWLSPVAGRSSVRTMPFGVMSKSHVKIRVMGNPRDDHQHDKSLRQRGHFENRKDLRDDLDDQPAGHGIGGADLVDMAALQLGEEIREIHDGTLTVV